MTTTYFHEPRPTSTNMSTPQRVLAVGAHPDDIEFGCGATLAKWSQTGAEITIAILTDGSKGTWDPASNPTALALVRQGEARKAAGTLASKAGVEFLGWTDGELVAGDRATAQICHLIRKYRPEVVIGHDPWKRYRLHPDHRAAGFIVTDSVVAARDPHFLPELGLHHRPQTVLLFEADEANHFETFGELQLRTKIESLLCHRSQHESSMEISSGSEQSQVSKFRETVRIGAETIGAICHDELAEAFHLINAE